MAKYVILRLIELSRILLLVPHGLDQSFRNVWCAAKLRDFDTDCYLRNPLLDMPRY